MSPRFFLEKFADVFKILKSPPPQTNVFLLQKVSSSCLPRWPNMFLEEKRQEREVFNLLLSVLAPVGQILLHEAFLEKFAYDFKILKGQTFARLPLLISEISNKSPCVQFR